MLRVGRRPSKNRKRVLALWAKDPRCHWCRELTTIEPARVPQPLPPHRATLDHLYPKRIRSQPPKGVTDIGAAVLACYSCNTTRGDAYWYK